jgi:hypothetical protein
MVVIYGLLTETSINGTSSVARYRLAACGSRALVGGKVAADAEIAASLYNRARGMSVQATRVFLGKDGEPVYAPYVEHLPPDVGAAKCGWSTANPAAGGSGARSRSR